MQFANVPKIKLLQRPQHPVCTQWIKIWLKLVILSNAHYVKSGALSFGKVHMAETWPLFLAVFHTLPRFINNNHKTISNLLDLRGDASRGWPPIKEPFSKRSKFR